MPSKFGGIAVEEKPSRFGGTSVSKEDLIKRYQEGTLSPRQKANVEELIKRGSLQLPTQQAGMLQRSPEREQLISDISGQIGPLEAFLVNVGEGIYNVGRGAGLPIDPTTEEEAATLGAIKEEHPIASGAGRIFGEAAPFIPPGTQIGRLPRLYQRLIASGLLSSSEAALIARGRGEDPIGPALVAAPIGIGGEMLLPILSMMGRSLYQRLFKKAPKGAILDPTGKPTEELQEALDQAGISFEELTEDATEAITRQRPGADPKQVARKARFEQEGIPATRGEITQEFDQRALEQRLLETREAASEPFRQFKLQQSEDIKKRLRGSFTFGEGPEALKGMKEESGQLWEAALTGRKKLLRSQKNELYKEAKENAKELGNLPIFISRMRETLPSSGEWEDVSITAGSAVMDDLNRLLTKYGIKRPTKKMVDEGFEPTTLTLENFERFRKSLNGIARRDNTNAVQTITGPVKNALDKEMGELSFAVGDKDIPVELIDTLKKARKTVRQLKTEFSPKTIVGQITDVKKDGVTPIIEASKIYDKLVGKATAIEDTRRLMGALRRSGEKGKEAIASLQATTMMDLMEAGFGTESRKISGVKTFNPTAFKNRMETIGHDKIRSIFRQNPTLLKKLRNIDKIASDLIPEHGAVPKGSASVILDLANRLGLNTVLAKVPGGTLVIEPIRKLAQSAKTGADIRQALKAEPDVERLANLFDKSFPGIASALGVAAITEAGIEEGESNE